MSLNFLKNKTQKIIALLLLLLVITSVTFYPSLKNGFTNWDDDTYVVQNELIKNLSTENTGNFFTEPVSSNFHPLTMFSLALDYRFFELDAFYYHLHNLLLHLLNVCLVFFFIYFLSKQHIGAAFFVALIFGIHPMHVESVAWVSERKDLLYTFFFLIGLIIYVKNINTLKLGNYVLILLVFILSVFSKSAAVIFPVVLLLLDYYLKGKIRLKDITIKIPFFLISLVIGILAVETQERALSSFGQIAFIERFQMASYGFFAYIVKFFFPLTLNNLYIFPQTTPSWYFLLLAGAVIIVVFSVIRFIRHPSSPVLFSFFFYFITVVLVLQVIAVGMATIAERYTYVPYIGIAYGVFYLLTGLTNRIKKNLVLKKLVYAGVAIIILAFSVTAHNRTKVWKDGRTLWTDAIKKDRDNYHAHLTLGYYYYNQDQYKLAINQFNNTLRLKPENKSALYRRQRCYVELKELNKALNDLNKLRTLYEDDYSYDIGVVLFKQGKYAEALKEFRATEKAGEVKTAKLDLNIGLSLLNTGQLDESITYLNSSLEKDSASYEAWFSRGVAHYQAGSFRQAKNDLAQSINLEPDYEMAYWYRALIHSEEDDHQGAYDDFSEVLRIDNSLGEIYYYRSVAAKNMGKFDLALRDALKAKELGHRVPDNYIKQIENRIPAE